MADINPDGLRTRADFAEALTRLRTRAGLTVRDLAKQLNRPAATIGDYFSGRHVPSTHQIPLFRDILRECGIVDGSVERWVDALARVRATTDGRTSRGSAPYRGLEAFQAEDADLFFGRAATVRAVLASLAKLCDEPGPTRGVMAVVGPSGSGKSSLLRAGVAPAVSAGQLISAAESWRVQVMTPAGASPQRIRDDVATCRADRLLLVVDQFEEVFISCSSDTREVFLRTLTELDPSRVLVVLGMRADFYPTAVAQPALLPVLRHAQELIGPMTTDEVRQAIVEPAARVGVTVDSGLVELLLADLAPRTATGYAHHPGALPFLSHALLATWEQASRNHLTVEDYRAVGGLKGAIRQTAENLYAALDPAERQLARLIFLRLVNVSEAAVTRRRLNRAELTDLDVHTDVGEASAEGVLDQFIARRLVTASADTLEVSHEALLTAWPRLSEWIEDDRDGLRAHRQLTDAANLWRTSPSDETLLLRGTRLDSISGWAEQAGHGGQLNGLEREYLGASRARSEREQRAIRWRTRRLRMLVAAVTVLALGTSTAATAAWRADRTASTARDQALSREISLEAERLQPLEPNLAAQLALAAYRISPTVTARGTLIDATSGEIPQRLLGPSGPTFLSLSHDGRLLAITHADDGSVHLYRKAGTQLTALGVAPGPSPAAQMFSVALTPDGQTLAAGGADDVVTLWRVSAPTHPEKLATLHGMTTAVQNIAISSDGTLLAAVGDAKGVRQWNITDPAHPVALPDLPTPGGAALQAVAYSTDGHHLAAVGAHGTIAVWPLDHGVATAPAATASAGTSDMTAVIFKPDSDLLATAARNTTVQLWSLNGSGEMRQAHEPLVGSTAMIYALAFSADGRILASGNNDNTVHTWNTSDWSAITTFNQPGPITSVAFEPAGKTLVAAGADGAARFWSLPPPQIQSANGNIFELNYSPDGRTLLTISSGTTGAANLWNVANPREPTLRSPISLPSGFGPTAGAGSMSADGKLVAVPNRKAEIQLIDTSDPARPRLVGSLLTGPKPLIEQMPFSPNGNLLAAGDDAGQVHLWDIRDPAHPKALPTLTGPASMALFTQFSPDSKLIAVGSADKKVWLWNVADPAHPRHAATLTGFTNYAFSLAFTPDGKTLIAGSADHTVRLWDVRNPNQPKPLGGPITACTDYVYFVATSPDGNTLATACDDGTVGLWNIAKPAHPVRLATLHASSAPMLVAAFAPDRTTMAATGADHLVRFWTYQPTQAAAKVCDSVGDAITRTEWNQYIPGAPYNPPCT